MKISWIFLTLLAFTIFAVIGAYSARMTNDYTSYDQQRAEERKVTLEKLRTAELQTLTTADWVDQSKGIIRIPIDEAMVRVIADLRTKAPQLGCPIATAAPSTPAPAAASPATTNAAPAASAAPSAPPAKKEAK